MLNLCALTLDIDWAPDCVLDEIAGILVKKEVRATWFVTHDSPGIRRLLRHKYLFEFGLHPNFLPNSSQGRNSKEIMTFLRAIVPEAKTIRTHSLFQSSPLLAEMMRDFNVETDVSILLPGAPHILPHIIYYEDAKKGLLRVPYFWEDYLEMTQPSKSWDFYDPKYHVPGLKIFNFHPLYIYLNSPARDGYEKVKKLGPLYELSSEDIAPHIHRGKEGVRNLFDSLVEYLIDKQKETFTVSDISQLWGRKK